MLCNGRRSPRVALEAAGCLRIQLNVICTCYAGWIRGLVRSIPARPSVDVVVSISTHDTASAAEVIAGALVGVVMGTAIDRFQHG